MNLENEFTVPVPVDEAWRVLLDVERVAPCMPGATLTSVDGDEFTGTVKVKVGPITVTYKGEARFLSKDDATHHAVIEAKGKESRGSGTAGAKVSAQLVGEGSTTKVRVDTELNVTGRPAQFGRGVMAEVAAKLIDQFAKCLEDEINSAPSPAAPAAETTGAPAAVSSTDAAARTSTSQSATAKVSPAKKTAAATGSTARKTAAAKKTAPPSGTDDQPGTASTAPAVAPTPSAMTEPAPAPAAPAPPQRPAQPQAAAPRREAEPIDLLDVAGGSVAKRLVPVVAAVILLLLVLRRRRHS